jgi:hypothetical protein
MALSFLASAYDYYGDPPSEYDEYDGSDDPARPSICPRCDGELQYDPADPDVGIMTDALYCETPGCDWVEGD